MPKQKTHKGLAKRVRVTSRRKIKHHRAGASHLMSVKSPQTKRKLRRPTTVGSSTLNRKMIDALNA
jgi:large subunit ribosomal protein L35